MKTVAVILGGDSPERKISLISGEQVYRAVNSLKNYRAIKYDSKTDLAKLRRDRDKIDLAFPVLHGKGGEDGEIQKFLEKLKIPYVGSRVKASQTAIDKIRAKKIYQKNNLPILPHWVMQRGDPIPQGLKLPVMVKPNTTGSSIGMTIIRKKEDLPPAIKQAFRYDNKILLEKYLKARELTVPVIGAGKTAYALPAVEIIPTTGEFFDYRNKYDGTTREIAPARISPELSRQAQNLSLKAHQALDCRGLTRTDLLLDNDKFYLLETNTIPGLTPESLAPKSAAAAGMSFKELIKKLLEIS